MRMTWSIDGDSCWMLRVNGRRPGWPVEASEEDRAALIYELDEDWYDRRQRLEYEGPERGARLVKDERGITRPIPVSGLVEILYVHDIPRGFA